MSRQGENIRKRIDGRWEARIVQGRSINGKTNYKYLYAKTYHEAKQMKDAYCIALETKILFGEKSLEFIDTPERRLKLNKIDPQENRKAANILFKEAADRWLADKKISVKESTIAYYVIMLNNQILPDLGNFTLSMITTQVLSEFLAKKKACGTIKTGQPLKDKTIADIKTIIRQILAWANINGLLDQIPVCPAISVRQKPIEILTKQEQNHLEDRLLKEDNSFSLGVWLSLYCGLRIGEVCALKWEDIDFEDGTVHVRKTINRITNVSSGMPIGTKLIITSPKTNCSIRTIPLQESVLSYLKVREGDSSSYVITGTKKFLEPRSTLARFKRFLKRAGIKDHTWHALRHTFATRCVESGVDIKSLSEIMGHSDVKITLQRYVHPSMDAKKNQLNKLTCNSIKQEMSEQLGNELPSI